MYEDIYKGLTEREKDQMIKSNIPKFETIGTFEMSNEENERAREYLHDLAKEFKDGQKRK